MDVENLCGVPGIAFIASTMNGQSFYAPNLPYTNNYVNDLFSVSMGYIPVATTWTGAISSDWDDDGNWTDCVPDATSNVTIGS